MASTTRGTRTTHHSCPVLSPRSHCYYCRHSDCGTHFLDSTLLNQACAFVSSGWKKRRRRRKKGGAGGSGEARNKTKQSSAKLQNSLCQAQQDDGHVLLMLRAQESPQILPQTATQPRTKGKACHMFEATLGNPFIRERSQAPLFTL